MRYRQVREDDLPQLLSLWLDCFADREEAAKLFFERNLSDPHFHGFVAVKDGAVIAAVYLVGCTLCGKPAHYLCGAATKREFRGRGVMTALIGFALRDAARRGDCCSVLLPAEEGLYRFYGRLGYVACGAVCQRELTACGTAAAREAGLPDPQALQKRRNGDKFLLWNNNYLRFAADYYACHGVKRLETARAFALYEQSGDTAEVFYAVYEDLEELRQLLFCRGVRRFTLTGSAHDPVFRGCEARRCGMAKPLQEGVLLPERLFIGITLD